MSEIAGQSEIAIRTGATVDSVPARVRTFAAAEATEGP